MQGANPFPSKTPSPPGFTPPPEPTRANNWLIRMVPNFVGWNVGAQIGLVAGGKGGGGSISFTDGIFLNKLSTQQFWSGGGFVNPTLKSFGLLGTLGAGGGLTLSNATNPNDFAGKAQTFAVSTLTPWGRGFLVVL